MDLFIWLGGIWLGWWVFTRHIEPWLRTFAGFRIQPKEDGDET